MSNQLRPFESSKYDLTGTFKLMLVSFALTSGRSWKQGEKCYLRSDETLYATDGASSQLGRVYPKKSRVHLRLVSLATRNGQQASRLNKTR